MGSTWTLPHAGRRLTEIAASGDTRAAWDVVGTLMADAGAMCGDNDLPRIARAQGQVTRWVAKLSGQELPLRELLEHQLSALAATLDAGWRTALLRADATQALQASGTLRERIVALLGDEGTQRPSDIARQLNRDPAQVSRALRTLVEQGRLVRHVPHDGDDRAVTYELVPVRMLAPAA
jgi:hypothetical protein